MSVNSQYLEDLLKHPGWLLFKEHARKEWGPEGYGKKIKQAVEATMAEKGDVAAAVMAVNTAAKEMDVLMAWPERELAVYRPKPEAAVRLQRA